MENFYNEVLTDHNLHPLNKRKMDDADVVLEGVNPSCGDDIFIYIKAKDGKISEVSFSGDGCAISQASADIMSELVVGKTIEEAKTLIAKFNAMIKGTATDEDVDDLEEAAALKDISYMPARVKCALLSWRTLGEIIRDNYSEGKNG